MAKKIKWKKIKGTRNSDTLTGSLRSEKIWGRDGDDIIDGGLGGNDKAWGGKGADRFITNTENTLQIMDFEKGIDKIEYCGCAGTYIEARDNDAYLIKDSQIKAIIMGAANTLLVLDPINKVIF
jgi:Ca2+-binding RTX toxin-like protein